MKIAHIISTFPPKIGGMGQVCWEEAKRLVAAGHEVRVLTLDYPETRAAVTEDGGFKVVRLKSPRLGDAGWAWQLLWRARGFDLVHLHYPFYGAYEWILLARWLWGQRYVVTYHMDASPSGWLKKTLQKIYDSMWARAILRYAEGIITVDEEHLKSCKYGAAIRTEKIVEIANGVDVEEFPNEGEAYDFEKWPEMKNKKVYLFVGNPLPFKRLDFLLEAVKLTRTPETVLVINSGGYEVEKYKALARDLKLDDRVLFLGRQEKREDLAKLYRCAECLVVPSLGAAESFSLVAIEASACGCPVIVGDAVGLRHRVSDGVDGYLFKPDSREDLARQIDKILNLSGEERESFRRAARTRAVERYTWERHIEKLENFYKNVDAGKI